MILDKINGPDDVKKLNETELRELAEEIRSFLIEKISHTGGHLASNLGVVELTVAIHRVFDTAHDRLVFDVGHQAYVHKALTGRRELFGTLRQLGGLSGFPKPWESPHDAFIAGHASNSVSVAVGMALAGKMDGRDYRVYTIMGDGELAEGSVWEGAMSGGNYQLDNLCALVDRNRLQISGSTEDVMKQDSQEERWAAFGWNVLSIPGNDVQAIDAALTLAAETKGKPTVIILNTVKGYGSPVMEDKAAWHHHLPNDEEYAQIIADFAAHKEAING